ncbi:MAG: flagellar basal body-associated FliL family protein [Oligoflexia bacterium]|nr:flagellar basal body-associated FliL family protein [Oligoflexia bacterium]
MSAADKKDDTAGAAAAKKPLNLPLIVGALNVVVALGAMGALVYTRVIYKRPAITESTERARLARLRANPVQATRTGTLTFEPVTVNIQSTPRQLRAAEGTARQVEGKLHYVTLAFVIEIRDERRKDELEAVRSQLMDRLLALLGRKTFHELSTVQGRYILKTQIIDSMNQLLAKRADKPFQETLITDVFFTQFLVQ